MHYPEEGNIFVYIDNDFYDKVLNIMDGSCKLCTGWFKKVT